MMTLKGKKELPLKQKKTILQTIKEELQLDQSILFVFVHGSFIEEEIPFSDLDLAVYFDQSLAQDDLVDLCLALAVHLSALVGLPVDVQPLNNSRIGFSYEAARGKLLFTVNEELCFDFIEKTRMKYYDLKPFWEENLQDLLSAF